MKDNSAPHSAPNSAPNSAPTPTTAGNALATEQAPLISAVSSEAIIPALTPQIPSTQQIPSATASAAPSAPLPIEELIDIEHFAKVQLRVGQVVAAEKVEKSKKLLKLQVNLGNDLGTRQILSGISQIYAPLAAPGDKNRCGGKFKARYDDGARKSRDAAGVFVSRSLAVAARKPRR